MRRARKNGQFYHKKNFWIRLARVLSSWPCDAHFLWTGWPRIKLAPSNYSCNHHEISVQSGSSTCKLGPDYYPCRPWRKVSLWLTVCSPALTLCTSCSALAALGSCKWSRKSNSLFNSSTCGKQCKKKLARVRNSKKKTSKISFYKLIYLSCHYAVGSVHSLNLPLFQVIQER